MKEHLLRIFSPPSQTESRRKPPLRDTGERLRTKRQRIGLLLVLLVAGLPEPCDRNWATFPEVRPRPGPPRRHSFPLPPLRNSVYFADIGIVDEDGRTDHYDSKGCLELLCRARA